MARTHRLARRSASLMAVPLVFGGVVAIGTQPAAAAPNCVSHHAAQPPSPGALSTELDGIDLLSPCEGWAVGSYANKPDLDQTLIEHWNGTKWKTVKSPNPGGKHGVNRLSSVVAISAKDAWAVGTYQDGPTSLPLTEHWNGQRWTAVAAPTPAGGTANLYSVDATSANDVWAVGETCSSCGGDETVVLHWNGHKWKLLPSANPTSFDQLSSVSAVSPRDVWAVGTQYNGTATETLIEHWDGTSWKVVASPQPSGASNPSYLYDVSMDGARSGWATGQFYDGTNTVSLALRWNGKTWKTVTTVNPSATFTVLYGVTSISKNSAWAVGEQVDSAPAGQGLVEHWNGTKWKDVTGSLPGSTSTQSILYDVAAAKSSVWAVGTYTPDTVGLAMAVSLN